MLNCKYHQINERNNKMAKNKSNEQAEKPVVKGIPVHGVYGIFLLIVAASILFANYWVYFGVDDVVKRAMLIPSTLAVVFFLVYKAAK